MADTNSANIIDSKSLQSNISLLYGNSITFTKIRVYFSRARNNCLMEERNVFLSFL